jgi:hypothetical protein
MLAIILVTGSRSMRVCKLHKMLKRSSGEFLFFQVTSQASGEVLPSAAEIRPRSRSTVIGISELPFYPTFSSKEVSSVWRLNIGRPIQWRVSQELAISAFRPSRLQHAKNSSVISRDAKCRERPGTRAHKSAEKIRAVRQQRHVARDPAESGIGELKVPRTWQQESRYPDTRFPDGAENRSGGQVSEGQSL